MRVTPDTRSAVADQRMLTGTVWSVLDQRLARGENTKQVRRRLRRHLVPGTGVGCYPGLVDAARRVQRHAGPASPGTGTSNIEKLAGFLEMVLERAHSSAVRARRRDGWHVDLPPPEPHLKSSVRRALAQIPKKQTGPVTAAVVGWDSAQRDVFESAAALLRQSWPEMFAELSVVIRQVALLSGAAINGFTDFTTHGVVYVNQNRLRPVGHKADPRLRLAEALVHEGVHNRCNVAAMTTSFLVSSEDVPRLRTPLRSDPRPLSGLFQQILVIARCVELYDRALDSARIDSTAARARRDALVEKGIRGVRIAQENRSGFTDAGAMLVDEADWALRAAKSGKSPT